MSLFKKNAKKLFFFLGRFAQASRMVENYSGCGAILMYHRILPRSERIKDPSPNKDQLVVSLERFEEQMRIISNNYKTIKMDDLPRLIRDRDTEFRVAVTFDDGYKDNLVYALPVLKKYNVPATIYITTRFPVGECDVWWIELAEICYSRDIVTFDWEGKTHRIDLHTPAQKHHGFNKLKKMVKSVEVEGHNQLMVKIRQPEQPVEYSELFLTWEEIRSLDREPLITIGAHTHSHLNLKNTDISKAVSDIEKGRNLLEENVGHPVKHFAFPYGYYDKAALDSYGLSDHFDTGVSTDHGPFDQNSDIYCLPRFHIKEEDDKERINIRLSGWENYFRSMLKRFTF